MNARGLLCGAALAALIAPQTGQAAPIVAVACVLVCVLAAARVDRNRKARRG